ncbi:hypothetical protein BD770DRAFT_384356 [Pilaira anomala]|nr:hypothetical protein BD770DRAFT_384356 [Pilaira anomala]
MAMMNESVTIKGQILHYIFKMIPKLEFFGILLLAFIPNSLFDLAGITCGHFKILFTTFFFWVTFLGKACVKVSNQTLLVILVFSDDTMSIAFIYSIKRNIVI